MDFPVPRDFDIALFFERLWLLLNDPSKRNILRWSENGKKIVIWDDTRMPLEICPLFFQLCTWSNFLQTLYACRFRRVRRDGLEFSHQVFTQRRLQALTREERHELFRTELGYKASRLTNRGSLPDTWEDWLGTDICKRSITNAAGYVQVSIVTPVGESSTANTADVPRPRVRKNTGPRKIEDEIIDVETVCTEELSAELPGSTTTTHRGSPSNSSALISEQHSTVSDDELTRNDGREDNVGEQLTHQASTTDDQDDSTSNNDGEGQGNDNSDEISTNQESSNHDDEGQGNDNSDDESSNQESSNNDGEGQDERSGNENSDESTSGSNEESNDEAISGNNEPGDEATSGNDESGDEATSGNDESGDEATSGNDESGDDATGENEEESPDSIDKSPPVKTRRLRKPETSSKCTRESRSYDAGPSTSAATNEPSSASNEDSEKMEDQSVETSKIKMEPIIVRIPKKYLLKKYKRKRERDD